MDLMQPISSGKIHLPELNICYNIGWKRVYFYPIGAKKKSKKTCWREKSSATCWD